MFWLATELYSALSFCTIHFVRYTQFIHIGMSKMQYQCNIPDPGFLLIRTDMAGFHHENSPNNRV